MITILQDSHSKLINSLIQNNEMQVLFQLKGKTFDVNAIKNVMKIYGSKFFNGSIMMYQFSITIVQMGQYKCSCAIYIYIQKDIKKQNFL